MSGSATIDFMAMRSLSLIGKAWRLGFVGADVSSIDVTYAIFSTSSHAQDSVKCKSARLSGESVG